MPTHCTTIDLPNNRRRKVIACFDGGRMSSDGGALLLRSADRALNLTGRIADCFTDHRNPHRRDFRPLASPRRRDRSRCGCSSRFSRAFCASPNT